MVVEKLESYVLKAIPGAVQPGNLKHLIEQELQCGRDAPTIVLDASSFKSFFYAPHFQRHPKTVKKTVESFVENIISYGANLIVVLRGNCVKNARTWFYRKRNFFLEIRKELSDIIEGKMPYAGWPHVTYCTQNAFASTLANQYKVFKSIEYVHKEVAEIAITQNCLAVIGQDSNYFIYEGIKYYILTKSLDLETLNCKIFERAKLIEHLGLKSYHLPLFATLCGNDEIYSSTLASFHKKISQPHRTKFLSIAEVVKQFSSDPYEHIQEVVKLINHPGVQDKLIKKSLDMYLNFEKIVPKNKLMVFADERKKQFKWYDPTHKILTLREFRCGNVTALAPDSLTSQVFLKPLRQKIYGIVLYKNENQIVAEYSLEEMANPAEVELLIPVKVAAAKPECEHPGLILLYDDETPNVYSLRWNLFCNSISRVLTPPLVRTVPPALCIPVLALHYLDIQVPKLLSENIFKERFEVEAFLVVAVLCYEEISSAHLEEINFSGMDARVVSLILKFNEVGFTLRMLNEVCGLVISVQQSCPCNYFDGVLFNSVYESMRKGTEWREFFGGNIALEILFMSLLELILKDN